MAKVQNFILAYNTVFTEYLPCFIALVRKDAIHEKKGERITQKMNQPTNESTHKTTYP